MRKDGSEMYQNKSSKLIFDSWSEAIWVPGKDAKIYHITMTNKFGKYCHNYCLFNKENVSKYYARQHIFIPFVSLKDPPNIWKRILPRVLAWVKPPTGRRRLYPHIWSNSKSQAHNYYSLLA